LLGLPASESDNPLVLPLAGHEIGHPLWRLAGLGVKFSAKVDTWFDNLLCDTDLLKRVKNVFQYRGPIETIREDLFISSEFAKSHDWANRQIEEVFCDFVGCRIFGRAFMRAFAYIAAAEDSGPRVPPWGFCYPKMLERAQIQIRAANAFGYPYDPDFVDQFRLPIDQPNQSEHIKMLSEQADLCRTAMIDDLVAEVFQLIASDINPLPGDAAINGICARFRQTTPAEHCSDLREVLEATWIAALDPNFWNSAACQPERRLPLLRNLALKSMEIMEFEALAEDARGSGIR
jgi:hypothetical protein